MVLPIGAEIDHNYVSNHNKFTIRQKLLFLLKAYKIALDEMKVGVRWLDHICHKAVVELNNYGIKTASDMNHCKIDRCLAKINSVV